MKLPPSRSKQRTSLAATQMLIAAFNKNGKLNYKEQPKETNQTR